MKSPLENPLKWGRGLVREFFSGSEVYRYRWLIRDQASSKYVGVEDSVSIMLQKIADSNIRKSIEGKVSRFTLNENGEVKEISLVTLEQIAKEGLNFAFPVATFFPFLKSEDKKVKTEDIYLIHISGYGKVPSHKIGTKEILDLEPEG